MTEEDDWIRRSALKILQDISDIQQFPITEHLAALDYIETPNGEDAAIMKRYNQSFVSVYSNPAAVSIEYLEKVCEDWAVPKELTDRMGAEALELQNNEETAEKVNRIYSETLNRTEEFFNTYCV